MKALRRLAAWVGPRTERAAVVEECEARILYSADLNPAAWGSDAQMEVSGAIVGMLEPESGASTSQAGLQQASRQEIVFVDTRVQGYEELIAGMDASAEVVLLSHERDGIEQIADHLRGRTGIDAIHLVSHGNVAELRLGDAVVTQDSLTSHHADLLARIGHSLSADADLLIYGCNFGQGEAGLAAMQTLARLTGADVAASTDLTGHAARAADWDLERSVGAVEATTVVGASVQASWSWTLATYTVTNTNDAGAGSLRQAILDANANAGADTVAFAIGGGGVQTINVAAALPSIDDQLLIDGRTQAGYAGAPLIVLNGSAAAADADGLVLTAGADNSVVRGLVIQNFGAYGIFAIGDSALDTVDNLTIAGNYIGTDATGASVAGTGNGSTGIALFDASNVTIGGTTAADRNVIAGNGTTDLDAGGINVGRGSSNVVIIGNHIGLDATGTAVLGSGQYGVLFDQGATSSRVGGTGSGEGNRISGAVTGVEIANFGAPQTNGIAVLGNIIVGNSGLGIDLGENGADGVTANDAGDVDVGPNGLQNHPVLTSADSNATGTSIVGSLGSNANTTYRVEFFANRPNVADASNGEGERYLGFVTVTTDGAGNAVINATLAGVWVNGSDRITATATVDLGGGNYGSTSEFSANVTATSTGIVVVDTISDVLDGTTTSIAALGAARGADGRVSLREAIIAANNTANGGTPDKIVFAIEGTGWHTIRPDAALPTITGAVILDATTDDSFAANGSRPAIVLDGENVVSPGLTLSGTADGSTIRGFVIRDFFGHGIEIQAGSDGNTVAGNYIGRLTAQGLDAGAVERNTGNGIRVLGSNNTIGGSTAADRNVIAGNGLNGIAIEGDATGNVIAGNYIGTDASGTTALGNVQSGLSLSSGADATTIGGTTAGARNLISGNTEYGIRVDGGDENTIQGNYIGTDVTGTAALGNGISGIWLRAAAEDNTIAGNLISGNVQEGIYLSGTGTTLNVIRGNYIGITADGTAALGNGVAGIGIDSGARLNLIGGTTAAERNVISGNAGYGVLVFDADDIFIRGNYIGTNAAGTAALGNGLDGVLLDGGSSGATIGGQTAPERNVISGNGGSGLHIRGATTGFTLVGVNYIGTDAAGTANLGNAGDGVRLSEGTFGNLIGGPTGQGNRIAFNGGNGILLLATAGINNALLGNSIHSNALLGIDLGNDGVTANDAGDADAGPNGTQNYPVLTNVVTNGSSQITVAGTLNALANTRYRIEFFSNPAGDPSGHGEGRVLVGSVIVTTDASGNASFSVTRSASVAAGDLVTATATGNPSSNTFQSTSEFSLNFVAAPNNAPVNTVPGTQTVAEDSTLAFTGGATISVNDADGNLASTRLTITSGVLLVSLAGGATVTSGANGSSALTLSGSQAQINAALATLTYQPPTNFAGNRTLTVLSTDGLGATDSDSVTITVTAVNDAPVLDNSGTMTLPTIDEDNINNTGRLVSEIIASAGGNRITDVDAGAVEGIAITSLNSGNGTWQFSTDGGTSWNAVGAVSDTSALLLRAADRLRFVPDRENADSASVSFRAWDQASGSTGTKVDASVNGGTTAFSTATENASITVTAVNDAPVLDTGGTTTLTTINEDAVNNSGNTVAEIIASAGGDRIADVDNGAVEGISLESLNAGNGTWQYSLDDGGTWSDVGAVSNLSALLLRAEDRLRFVPNGENADAASVTFRAWDQSTGTAGTKASAATVGGTNAFSLAARTASITVTAVNDAPVLDNTGTMSLPAITENATNTNGRLVSDIILSAGGNRITEVDTGALEGIAVNSLDSGNGTWQFSTDGGTVWTNVGTVSDTSALLLRATDRLRFVPDAQNADSAAVTFRAWDQTSGSTGTKADTSVNGGTTAFSAATETASITVTAVNDAPVLDNTGTMTLTTIDEDAVNNGGNTVAEIIASAGGDRITDVDNGALEGIALTGLDAGRGTWQYSLNGGSTWANVGPVSDSSALLLRAFDRLRFVPDAIDADTASITFRAWDRSDGTAGTKLGTSPAGGTTAFSTASETASITVTAVNDAPVITSNGGGASASINVAENTTAVTTVTATDVDLPAQTLAYAIVGGADAALFAIDAATGALRFVSAPDFEAPADAGANNVYDVTVQVSDGAGGSDTQALNVTVGNVNDAAPVITSNGGGASASITVAENTTAVTTVTATDADLPAQTLTYAIVGGADAALFSIDAATGALRFVSAPDFEAPADDGANNVYEVTVRVSDGTGGTDTQAVRVTVSNVNEAPSDLAPATASVDETAPAGTVVATVIATDPDTGDVFSFALPVDADGRFAIDPQTGRIVVATGAVFDAALQPFVDLTVRVTDAGGLSFERSLRVNINGETDTGPIVEPTDPTPPPPAPPPAPAPAPAPAPGPSPAPAPVPEEPAPPAPPSGGGGPNPAGDGLVDLPETDASAEPASPGVISKLPYPDLRRLDGGDDLLASVSFEGFSLGDGPSVTLAAPSVSLQANAIAPDLRGVMPSSGDGTLEAVTTRDTGLGDDSRTTLPIAEMASDPLRVASATFTAGFIWWLTRSGGLITTMLMGVPAWRHVDLLPVLARADDEDESADDTTTPSKKEADEERAASLFDTRLTDRARTMQ
jgi:parallel beta-helix repeat protein